MRNAGGRRLDWTISVGAALIAMAMIVSTLLVIGYSTRHPADLPWFKVVAFLYFAVPVTAFAVLGLAILRREPRQPIAWILVVLGAGGAFNMLAGAYALFELPGRDWPVWISVVQGASIWGLLALMLLLFPTGRVPTRRWVPFARIVLGFVVVVTVGTAVVPWTYRLEPSVYDASNPAALFGDPWSSDQIDGLAFSGTVFVLISAGSLIVRWRRAAGDERQQLKWLGQAAILVSLIVTVGVLLDVLFSPSAETATSFLVGNAVAMLGLSAVPVAIGLAVSRYRLYDVDRIISRTLAYSFVTVVLAAVFGLLVLVPQTLLVGGSGASADAVIVVALATLVAATIFNPLRLTVQRTVDRRFSRRRYDVTRTVAEFHDRLREPRDLESLVDDVTGVVNHTMAPRHVGVWTPGGTT